MSHMLLQWPKLPFSLFWLRNEMVQPCLIVGPTAQFLLQQKYLNSYHNGTNASKCSEIMLTHNYSSVECVSYIYCCNSILLNFYDVRNLTCWPSLVHHLLRKVFSKYRSTFLTDIQILWHTLKFTCWNFQNTSYFIQYSSQSVCGPFLGRQIWETRQHDSKVHISKLLQW